MALDQPLMKKLAEKENELKTITILKAQENETLERLKAELAEVKLMISESEKRVSKSKIIAEQLRTISQVKSSANRAVLCLYSAWVEPATFKKPHKY